MKSQMLFCVSTFAVLISYASSHFPGYSPQYDVQAFGSDFGAGAGIADPLLALRLKNMKKLNKLSLGCEHAVEKASAIKSKCSKMFSHQLMKNKLALQELNSPFSGFGDQLYNLNQGQIYNAQPSMISAAQLQQAASPQYFQGAASLPNLPSPCSALQNFQASSLPNFQGSTLPNFQGSALPNFQGSALPNFQGSALPNLPASALAALQGLQGQAPQNFQSCSLPNSPSPALPNLPASVLAALQGLQEQAPQNFQSCPLSNNGQNPSAQVQNIRIPFDQIQRMSSEPMEYGTPIDHRIFNVSPNQNFEESFQQFGPQSAFQQQADQQSGPCMGGSQFEDFRPIGSPEPQFQGGQFQTGPVPFPGGDYQEGSQSMYN